MRRIIARATTRTIEAARPGWSLQHGLTEADETHQPGLVSLTRRAGTDPRTKTMSQASGPMTKDRPISHLQGAQGASTVVAGRIAAHARRWWWNSAGQINRVLSVAYFDRLGVPRLYPF